MLIPQLLVLTESMLCLEVLIKLWDIFTGKEIKTFKGHTESVQSVAFSSNGKYALSGSRDHTIKIWDTKT